MQLHDVDNQDILAMGPGLQWKRTWNIQDALDQYSQLTLQKDTFTKAVAGHMLTCRTSLDVAKAELDNALARARCLSPADAASAAMMQSLAARIRRNTRDFAEAQRRIAVDEDRVRHRLLDVEEEIQRSRREMTVLKEAVDDLARDKGDKPAGQQYRYCTNCKVGGHGQRFCEYLLKRSDWRIYPSQKWFQDDKGNEYHCPLGKKLVDFADETHFSKLSMYIKGRACLEGKTDMWDLVPHLMPDTYVIDDMRWRDGREPVDKEGSVLPWFVKEADRNWGTSVHCCQTALECMQLAAPGCTYVVQQHIADPLCMDDGRKCHIKFYVLLIGLEDGKTWHVYTFKDGYLSVSPNAWSPTDISKETQVTIIRTQRIGDWKHWEAAYPKCKAAVAEVVERGVAQGKLEGRLNKRQFEILSADFIVDTRGDVWLFEFNMSPVLKDAQDSPDTNDAEMITAALDIAVPREGSDPGRWDFVRAIVGEPPPPPKDRAAEGGQPAQNEGENATAAVDEGSENTTRLS